MTQVIHSGQEQEEDKKRGVGGTRAKGKIRLSSLSASIPIAIVICMIIASYFIINIVGVVYFTKLKPQRLKLPSSKGTYSGHVVCLGYG